MSMTNYFYEGGERHNLVTINGKHYLLAAPPTYQNMGALGGKVTFGDYTRESDENSSAKIWTDFSGGIGVDSIREGADDGGYWYGYLNAKSPFQLALGRETLELTNVKYPLAGFEGKFYATDGATYFQWDELAGEFVDTGHDFGATPFPGNSAVFGDKLWTPCGAAGVIEFDGSSNGVLDAAVRAIDLLEFDNHLYAITTDKKLCQFDGSSWSTLETFKWGDTPRSLCIYMNRLEDDILYVATDRGLLSWDKTNQALFRTRMQVPTFYDNGLGVAVWRAGEDLYYSSGMQVYQYSVGSSIPVGPGGRQGVPARVRGKIVDLEPSHNSLFALIEGAPEEVDEPIETQIALDNPSFASDASSWGKEYEAALWTGAFSYDGGEDADSVGGSGEYVLSVNTGPKWSMVFLLHDAVPAIGGAEHTLHISAKTTDADLIPMPVFVWLDASDNFIAYSAGSPIPISVGPWWQLAHKATAPPTAAKARVGILVTDGKTGGGTTGTVWVDGAQLWRTDIGAYLEGGMHYDDPLEGSGIATTAAATVMEYTGSGWHPCWEAPASDGRAFSIVKSSELDHERVFWGYGDSVFTQKLSKTSSLIRQQWEAKEARFAPSGYLDTGWFDGNMYDSEKLADRLVINVTNVTADSWFAVDYRVDNEDVWTSLSGPISAAADGVRGKVVIPFGVSTIDVDGVQAQFGWGRPFDRIRFRIRMETSDPDESCVIDSIVLKYVKQTDFYPLFSLAIDAGTKSDEILGRTPSQIKAELRELTQNRRFSWLRLGDFNNPVMRVLLTAERGDDATGNDQRAFRTITVIGYPLPGYDGIPADYHYEP